MWMWEYVDVYEYVCRVYEYESVCESMCIRMWEYVSVCVYVCVYIVPPQRPHSASSLPIHHHNGRGSPFHSCWALPKNQWGRARKNVRREEQAVCCSPNGPLWWFGWRWGQRCHWDSDGSLGVVIVIIIDCSLFHSARSILNFFFSSFRGRGGDGELVRLRF